VVAAASSLSLSLCDTNMFSSNYEHKTHFNPRTDVAGLIFDGKPPQFVIKTF
jgi:hypothetical protein